MNLEEQEKYFRSYHTGGALCKVDNRTVLEKKEAGRTEFETFPNSNPFVTWKMNFKSEVCSNRRFGVDQ